jgi:tight adherence protein B
MMGTLDRLAGGAAWLPYLAIALIATGGAAALVLLVSSPGSPIHRSLARYQAALDGHLRFLLSPTRAVDVVRAQAILIGAVVVAALVLASPLILVLAIAIALVPYHVARHRRERRIVAIELQLDGWLMVLSNALKAAPSLGEALATSAGLTRAPMSEELDLTLKEIRLGSPLDEALLGLATRVKSRTLWGAVATLLVSRQTGGDVSRTLEESADTLREMARLEGVVRAKTADGRNQATVLSCIPFGLVLAIHLIDPSWLAPLFTSTLGYAIVAAAGALWLLGFGAARRILAVEV